MFQAVISQEPIWRPKFRTDVMKHRVLQRLDLHLVSLGSAQKILIQTSYLCIQTCFFSFLTFRTKGLHLGRVWAFGNQYNSIHFCHHKIIFNNTFNKCDNQKTCQGGRFVVKYRRLLRPFWAKNNILECSPLMDSRWGTTMEMVQAANSKQLMGHMTPSPH